MLNKNDALTENHQPAGLIAPHFLGKSSVRIEKRQSMADGPTLISNPELSPWFYYGSVYPCLGITGMGDVSGGLVGGLFGNTVETL